jgi:hypothetical protein
MGRHKRLCQVFINAVLCAKILGFTSHTRRSAAVVVLVFPLGEWGDNIPN